MQTRAMRLAALVTVNLGWLAGAVLSGAAAQPNPYRTLDEWLAPIGRDLGSASSVAVDARGNVWLAERCGANDCSTDGSLDPILRLDASGRVLTTFGKGLFAWPHGIHVDIDGNVWVTDARAGNRRGHRVVKFSPDGAVLMTLGEAGVAGSDTAHFNGPTDVVVAANGDIFVTDGHEPESNNRVVKFARDGRFIKAWGSTGSEPGQFRVPHAVDIDSRGRVFVADRDNNRIQIFDQDGVFLEQWTQFGRPSGLHIGADDTLYVSDNQSNDQRHPGWMRGIRIGSARDGTVAAFVPDPQFDPAVAQETGAHGLTADALGNLYGADVWGRTVRKYVRQENAAGR
jgi:DNA-binding beta-propeller fold protein YncE